MQRSISQTRAGAVCWVRLSRRERQVLLWLCLGMQNKEIALEVGISGGMVRRYLNILSIGLHKSGRTQLQMWGLQHRSAFLGDWVPTLNHPLPCGCNSSICITLKLALERVAA